MEKHLEFIQGVINRHNSNSFRIKGWAITITAAIFALTGTVKEPFLCFIAFGPILMFWILDSIFLANERCFVSLYSCVANDKKLKVEKENLKKKIRNSIENDEYKEFIVSDYSMNFIQFREVKRNNWYRVLYSSTILWFYLVLTILTMLTYLGLNSLNKSIDDVPIKINATIEINDSLKIHPIDINTRIISTDTITFKQIEKEIKQSKK